MSVIFVRKAQALPGKEFEAVKWGVEIAKLSSELRDHRRRSHVRQQVGGPIGGWRATHVNMGALEAAIVMSTSTVSAFCRLSIDDTNSPRLAS
jgi:hypothetical protein